MPEECPGFEHDIVRAAAMHWLVVLLLNVSNTVPQQSTLA